MTNKTIRAAVAACTGGLLLTAAAAPGQMGTTISAVAPAWNEASPEISFAPVTPTVFPGSASPVALEAPANLKVPSDPETDFPAPADGGELIAPADSGELTSPAEDSATAAAPASKWQLASDELHCLSVAVYHEARGEPRDGKLAVAQVVLNRAKSGRFPKSVCGVVLQPAQFSAIRTNWNPRESSAWREARAIAALAAEGERLAHLGDALYFHATYVSPGWRGKKRVATIGNHIFYR